MPEHILDVLLDGVGRFCERAERRDIDEVPLAEFAHIERSRLHAHGGGRRLGGIRRDIQARGKVVRAAAGQIAHERAVFSRNAHHTVHRFVERAVAAVADDDVEFRPERFGELRRFSAVRGLAHGDEIARLGIDRGGVKQRCEGFGLSRAGIDDKEQLFVVHGFLLVCSSQHQTGKAPCALSKALTAIALLFAIQALKPSPFCLLDEIEAALDDSNVSRFASYLNKLTKNTQFIVITHRRGTMTAADRLYGITMQEKGVSTLVSVDLIEHDLN